MDIKCQWIILRRFKIFYIYSLIIYLLLAFYDINNAFQLDGTAEYIDRCNFQQIVLVFSIGLICSLLLNEESIELFNALLNIYANHKKSYYYSIMLVVSACNIIFFVIGQIICFVFNRDSIPFSLCLVNLCIVSMEIIIAVQFFMAIRLLVKKTLLTYILYIAFTFLLLMSNNVFIALPLNISILETEGYYYTFGWQLWIGRIMLLVFSNVLFYLSALKAAKESEI